MWLCVVSGDCGHGGCGGDRVVEVVVVVVRFVLVVVWSRCGGSG